MVEGRLFVCPVFTLVPLESPERAASPVTPVTRPRLLLIFFIELKQRLHSLNLPPCPFVVETSDGITHHGTHVATVVLRFILEHLRLIRSETDF